MEDKIISIFRSLDFNINYKGYKLWIELIKLAMEEKEYKIHLEKLYKKLELKTGLTRDRIERNLRTVIGAREESIRGYFYYYNNKVTIKSFLMLILEELKKEEEE